MPGLFAHTLVLALMAICALGSQLDADFYRVMFVIRFSQRRTDQRSHHIKVEQPMVRVHIY